MMVDLAIELDDRPGMLARMGTVLGGAGISIEGGGAWVVEGRGIAHFLVADGAAARAALEEVGISVLGVRPVLMARLRQEVPGQLGELAGRMAAAGINIEVQYSDHDGQLVLVVDDHAKGEAVVDAWRRAHSPLLVSGTSPDPRLHPWGSALPVHTPHPPLDEHASMPSLRWYTSRWKRTVPSSWAPGRPDAGLM
jgi:hypothetical protein